MLYNYAIDQEMLYNYASGQEMLYNRAIDQTQKHHTPTLSVSDHLRVIMHCMELKSRLRRGVQVVELGMECLNSWVNTSRAFSMAGPST